MALTKVCGATRKLIYPERVRGGREAVEAWDRDGVDLIDRLEVLMSP